MKTILIALIIALGAFTASVTGALVVADRLAHNQAPKTLGDQLYNPGTRVHITTAGTGDFMTAANPVSTTTPVFLIAGAAGTTTMTGSYQNATALDLSLLAIGSSSPAVLAYAMDVSDNAIDWYTLDSATTTASGGPINSVLHAPVGLANLLPLATTTASGNSIFVHTLMAAKESEKVTAKYWRLRFSVNGANASLWAEAVPRLNY